MKRSLAIFCTLISLVLLFGNFVAPQKKYIFAAIGDQLNLPDTPFDYSNIIIPSHISSPEPDDDIGYGSTGVSPNTILNIEDDKATLGRVLFYDTKLSTLENLSCASCHHQELSFTEDKRFSEGNNALTKRNSMNLNDLFWSNKDHFLWDMGETSIFDMIRLPLKDENEIGADMNDIIIKLNESTYYPELFSKAYNNSTTITEDKIVEALVHFISSMTTFESEFDQAAADDFEDFTESESLGLELFSTHCSTCHSQGSHNPFGEIFPGEFDFFGLSPLELFPEIFNNGLPVDPDDRGAGSHEEIFNDLFKIPTLRNIAVTGPYMHDGRFGSLDEVIDHYSEGIVPNRWTEINNLPDEGFGFTTEEKNALKAFLLTLTDQNLLTHDKWSNPFAPLSIGEAEIANLLIMPNPMANYAVIKFDNKSHKETIVTIRDVNGQLVKNITTKNNRVEIRKGEFAPGTYLIDVTQGQKKSMQKLIVQ